MMKRILSLLLIFALTFSSFGFVYASPNTNDNNNLEEVTEIELTYEEYIEKKADSLGVTIDEAKLIDDKENKKYEKDLKKRYPDLFIGKDEASIESGYYTYKRISKTSWYNNYFAAAVYADLKIYNNGSFREITELMGIVYSERIAGWKIYTWEQSNSWSDPNNSGMPTTSITISATGIFTVEVSKGIEIGLQLAGFSLAGSGGIYDIYQSDPFQIMYTYSLY